MKAFISYSVSDNNEYILALLASSLQESNFFVTTSQNFYNNSLDQLTRHEINTSNLFIGIITFDGNEYDRVIQEWQHAVTQNIPNILLIEDKLPINKDFRGNYIIFDRHNPDQAISQVKNKMNASQPATVQKTNEILPWLLGGAAVVAVLSLLSNDN